MELNRPLFPLDVIEIRLQIGVVVSQTHAQWQLQVMDPVTRERLALTARPSEAITSPSRLIEEATAGLVELLEEIMEPFPDT